MARLSVRWRTTVNCGANRLLENAAVPGGPYAVGPAVGSAAPEPDFVGYDAGSPAVRDQVAHEHREEHRQLQAHAQALRDLGVDCTALLIQGPTVETILREAQRLDADLIVMATHGHGAVFDLVVGSVSHDVLRQARVPLVMVPVR